MELNDFALGDPIVRSHKDARPVECLLCGREVLIDEVFIFQIREDYSISHFQCLSCAEKFKDDRPLKSGGWGAGKRTLDGYFTISE